MVRILPAESLVLALITIPLYLTFENIAEEIQWDRSWQKERFLVNGKYIIVKEAKIVSRRDRKIVLMDILARERLTAATVCRPYRLQCTGWSMKTVWSRYCSHGQ